MEKAEGNKITPALQALLSRQIDLAMESGIPADTLYHLMHRHSKQTQSILNAIFMEKGIVIEHPSESPHKEASGKNNAASNAELEHQKALFAKNFATIPGLDAFQEMFMSGAGAASKPLDEEEPDISSSF